MKMFIMETSPRQILRGVCKYAGIGAAAAGAALMAAYPSDAKRRRSAACVLLGGVCLVLRAAIDAIDDDMMEYAEAERFDCEACERTCETCDCRACPCADAWDEEWDPEPSGDEDPGADE